MDMVSNVIVINPAFMDQFPAQTQGQGAIRTGTDPQMKITVLGGRGNTWINDDGFHAPGSGMLESAVHQIAGNARVGAPT